MPSTTVSVPGMHCTSCASLIKEVSAEFPAITTIDVDLASKRITLEHADGFDFLKWKQEVESLGNTYKILILNS